MLPLGACFTHGLFAVPTTVMFTHATWGGVPTFPRSFICVAFITYDRGCVIEWKTEDQREKASEVGWIVCQVCHWKVVFHFDGSEQIVKCVVACYCLLK
jgi:hypothetical protein